MSVFSRKFLNIILCILLTAALTACQESGVFVNNDENGNSYTLSKDLTFPSAVLRSINPCSSMDRDFYQVSRLVYEGLVKLDDTLVPQPCLASDWTIDTGSLTATFNLKGGIKFSDGSEFNSSDVVFSFNACKAAGQSPYKTSMDRLVSAEASGSDKVVFKFKSATGISPSDFVFPIVSSADYASVSSMLSTDDTAAVGTGPYMISSADLKEKLVLSPNTSYREKAPDNTITISISPVESPYTGFVESGKLSMIVETSTDREEVSGNDKLKVTDFTSNEFEALGFNCSSGPCASSALRKAIGFMVDRDSIKGAAYYNSGTKSDDLYYPGYYGTEISNTYTPDREAAAENLTAAGYRDTDADGVLEDSNGNELSLKLVIDQDNVSRKTAADMLVSSLLEYGIKLEVTEVAAESFTSVLNSGSYDMFIGGWKVSEGYDLRCFYHSAYSNPAHYSNKVLDGYLDRLQSGISGDEMLDNVNRVKEILQEDLPYLCLLYKTYAAVTSSDLDGLVAPRFNDYYYACNDWAIRIYSEDEEEDEYTTDITGVSADGTSQ